jgi:hypothetical protein
VIKKSRLELPEVWELLPNLEQQRVDMNDDPAVVSTDGCRSRAQVLLEAEKALFTP